jgi:predicted phosphohydrolase
MSTRFQLISDLHLEFYKYAPEIIPNAPYLLLAGDIGYPEKPIFQEFLKNVSKSFETIFFTPGNHEYYQNFKHNEKHKIKTIPEINHIIQQTIQQYPNIVYLNDSTYELDNIRLIGTTLWSNVKPTDSLINDYFQIYKKTPEHKLDNITISDIKNLHNSAVTFLQNEIKNNQKPNLVMTHHLPSKHLVIDEYIKKYPKYNSHFASDLDYLLDPEYITTWVCGHSHSHNEQIINGVQCYINAIGYPDEKYRGSNLDFTFTC